MDREPGGLLSMGLQESDMTLQVKTKNNNIRRVGSLLMLRVFPAFAANCNKE